MYDTLYQQTGEALSNIKSIQRGICSQPEQFCLLHTL